MLLVGIKLEQWFETGYKFNISLLQVLVTVITQPVFFLQFFTILFAQKVTCKYIMKTYFDEGKLFGGKFSVGIDPGISSVLVSSINGNIK